ncbi:hypothetical protein PVK62_08170 [Aliivibrio sp. S3MY1]|uniref:Conjugal transfer protein TrbC n=1 Tax=Aliivibrio finisterrensis TaxID=511998 RepID=A0ABY0I5Y4_9GAMM|nr:MULTISPECIES: DUF6750 family protein [Aliivibrio]MDD9175974.1 hypothetical protein [Aliivibrio sp. S3TY1]MDD9193111.1 hypothetical protein [Aliivibrio sp. S2TY2]MDD9195815.1 hypothetical protein [Aliivibrio sp. S3MY1]RYU63807.1 hypothetical protein ERW53_12255 [Aliivibrio finisterrensis]RYU82744.1 hypothetical protein ERW52_14080 [Aliivibrio finisterrensis]
MIFPKNIIKHIHNKYFTCCLATAGFLISPSVSAEGKGRNFLDLVEDAGTLADASSKASLSVIMLIGIVCAGGGLLGLALANKTNNAQTTRSGAAVVMFIGFCLMGFEAFSNMGTNTITNQDVEYTEFIE